MANFALGRIQHIHVHLKSLRFAFQNGKSAVVLCPYLPRNEAFIPAEMCSKTMHGGKYKQRIAISELG